MRPPPVCAARPQCAPHLAMRAAWACPASGRQRKSRPAVGTEEMFAIVQPTSDVMMCSAHHTPQCWTLGHSVPSLKAPHNKPTCAQDEPNKLYLIDVPTHSQALKSVPTYPRCKAHAQAIHRARRGGESKLPHHMAQAQGGGVIPLKTKKRIPPQAGCAPCAWGHGSPPASRLHVWAVK